LQEINQKKYCDGLDDSVVLSKEGTNRFHMNFTIVKEGFIDSVKDVIEPHGTVQEDYIPLVDQERTNLRELKAIRNAKAEADKIGEGVTEEAQHIFNALSKTLPCRWNNQSIVVLEEVEIKEPYGAADCKNLHTGDSTVLVRVKKVLEEERKKLGYV
jgi:hypothetical protein